MSIILIILRWFWIERYQSVQLSLWIVLFKCANANLSHALVVISILFLIFCSIYLPLADCNYLRFYSSISMELEKFCNFFFRLLCHNLIDSHSSKCCCGSVLPFFFFVNQYGMHDTYNIRCEKMILLIYTPLAHTKCL